MKISKVFQQKRKKSILAVSVLGVAALAIGGTIAYSQDHSSTDNKFQLFSYRTLFTETFDAPTNWKTCETIDKTITVKNEYDEPVSVRIKLEEQWIASDGTTELPLVSATSGYTMAQINFAANSGWTKQGNYYYYDIDLPKNGVTTTPITGVTLNCDANLDTQDLTADGAYSGANYHLKITAQTIEAAGKDTWVSDIADMVRKKANPDTNIDFTTAATVATGNGNGVNKYTEGGVDVYYFRGEVNDNNVIWADKCWKIVRTTKTGGTKMIYNGLPSNVVVDGETVKQCNATGVDSQITVNINGTDVDTFKYNNNSGSPADVGYMYGARISYSSFSPGSTILTFSNNVSRNGNVYTLDTSTGQSISGTWSDERVNAAIRYHYFCTDGTAACDGTKIGYIHAFNGLNSIYYLKVGGYNNIEDMKIAMFANTNPSNAKTIVETWFEQQNLDGHIINTRNYEDDLEDAVFCNDRSYYSGALKSKDSDAAPRGKTTHSYYGAYGRNHIENSQNNFEPSLDCANANDAFTKSSANGNGELNHKVGLATTDELRMASLFNDSSAYLYTGQKVWSISPYAFGQSSSYVSDWEPDWGLYSIGVSSSSGLGLRPIVSLKSGMEFASGTGLKTDPYIVE